MAESSMAALAAVAGMVGVGAVTPGPNNLVVMRTAARRGFWGALPEVAGVVLGGLALLGLVAVGGSLLFEAVPFAREALSVGGCLYLAWLGGGLLWGSFGRGAHGADTVSDTLPAGVAGLFGFQFLNPKSWVMAVTATAAAQGADVATTFAGLAVLFVVIPTLCLACWSVLGALLTQALRRPRVQAWFDRVMGSLLLASAVLLLLEA